MAECTPQPTWVTSSTLMSSQAVTNGSVTARVYLTDTDTNEPVGGYVEVTGSAQQVEQAFGVTFGMYKAPGGQTARAPEESATAPTAVPSDVLTVSGLDTAKHMATPGDTLPPPGYNY